MITPAEVARVTGGRVTGRNSVSAPAPGHSGNEMSVKINAAGDDIVVHLFNEPDNREAALAAKDGIKQQLGRDVWQKRNGHARPNDDEIDAILAGDTAPPPPPRGKPDCFYDYRDQAGKPVYRVERYSKPTKEFRQCRHDGNGGFIRTKVFDGVERVPYHLPELVSELAAFPLSAVLITEGEKDCDNVRRLGIIATCAAGNVWTPEMAKVLAGRFVYILADHDEAGKAHATRAATALYGLAHGIHIVEFTELAKGGDVSDWLAIEGNGSSDALLRYCSGTPAFEPSAEPVAPADEGQLLGEWDAGDDTADIPPRGWLLGNAFCRRFISSVIADGGTGKSALRLAQLLSLAVGRPLTGEYVFARCRVLIVSLEDNADELRRRVRAACLHHGVSQSELRGYLFLASPGLAGGKLVTLDPHGRPVPGILAAKLARTIAARKIDVASLDPFVKSHGVEENNNSMIDEVVQTLASLADRHDMAIDVPHHAAKGPADPGNANRGRGASSMKDAGRLVYTLTPMSPEEGQALGLSELQRRGLIRLDSAKVNITPPMAEAKWFRLVGIDIGNGTALYPNGDQVQTVEPWEPPATFAGLSNLMINEILTIIDAGLPDGSRYSSAPNAKVTAAWRVVASICSGKPEAICRKIIKLWLSSGLLLDEKYINPVSRKSAAGLRVDHHKRPS